MHLPIAVIAAFCTALVPSISSAIAKNNMEVGARRLSFSFFVAILIILPAAIGTAVISDPILRMIYPAAPEGAGLLALTTITMIFVSLNFVVNGGLYGLGKVMIPVVSLVIGGIIKLVLNIVLISNPNINVYGAVISSIVCQVIVFVICFVVLNKHIKLNINFKNHIFKPLIAAGIMGAGVFRYV
ncbi:MAG: polysaccharide biosynthesis C-terminal domain-containing protein [Oscillospiraceae bacterium]|nr:polysaccharide biosynthesis C-terminal domain-containing protein [Oscillospiraceae bacterium]